MYLCCPVSAAGEEKCVWFLVTVKTNISQVRGHTEAHTTKWTCCDTKFTCMSTTYTLIVPLSSSSPILLLSHPPLPVHPSLPFPPLLPSSPPSPSTPRNTRKCAVR